MGFEGWNGEPDNIGELAYRLQRVYAKASLGESAFYCREDRTAFLERPCTWKAARFAVKLGPMTWLSLGTADPGDGVALEVERRIFRLRRL